jgi:hypothetical protein
MQSPGPAVNCQKNQCPRASPILRRPHFLTALLNCLKRTLQIVMQGAPKFFGVGENREFFGILSVKCSQPIVSKALRAKAEGGWLKAKVETCQCAGLLAKMGFGWVFCSGHDLARHAPGGDSRI